VERITELTAVTFGGQAIEAARTFRPMGDQEVSALLARTSEAAASGKYEPFKTGDGFDGTARNPQWLG